MHWFIAASSACAIDSKSFFGFQKNSEFMFVPETHTYSFRITPRGIEIGEKLFKFEDLESFWIFYDPPEIKELAVRRKGLLVPELIIPLKNQDPVMVRRALITFLSESEQKYSAFDLFLRRIGF